MIKPLFKMFAFVFVAVGVGFAVIKTLQVPSTKVHVHANFLVVKNGEVMDFSGPEFMEIEPCTDDESADHVDSKTERVHLHDGNGGTAHVHAPFVTWQELFTYLKLEVPEDATYMLNGNEASNIPTKSIADKDTLLMVIGGKPQDLQQFIDKVPNDAAQYDDGSAGTESCGGSKNQTLSLWERFRIAFHL